MSFAVEPKSRGDEDKLASSIHRLTEEDPTICIFRNVQTKEMILSGMGQGSQRRKNETKIWR